LFDSSPTVFHDPRTGRKVQHDKPSLLRQSIYSRLAGYEDVNEAQRLSVDPAMCSVIGKKVERNAACTNTVLEGEND
jgi:Transposase DDE domain group 1